MPASGHSANPRRGVREIPVYISFEDGEIFAMLTEPGAAARGVAVVVAHGRGEQLTFHRNRVTLRLAQRLAEHGFHVVRFDYPGMGESTGTSRPFARGITHHREIGAVMDDVRRRGISRFVLLGYCIGGRSALAAAETGSGVEAVVLVSTPLKPSAGAGGSRGAVPLPRSGRFARRSPMGRLTARGRHLLSRWRPAGEGQSAPTDRAVRKRIEQIVQSGGSVLLIYGNAEAGVREARELVGSGPTVAGRGRLLLDDRTPGTIHGFLSVAVQDSFLTTAVDWLVALKTSGIDGL